jgi:arginine/lysine/ornithine decarboxylase
MLVLITAAIERGKSGTLLAELLRIKHEYDGGASLATVLPGLTEEHPERYGGLLFSDLCTEMHEFLRTSRADVLQQRAFSDEHQPEIAVGPSAAHAELIAGRVELVPLTDLANRIAATLIVPYPPGIAIMVPGERFTAGSAVLDYLQLFEDNDNRFPGFTSEIQGVFPRRDAEGKLRYHTYVLSETG